MEQEAGPSAFKTPQNEQTEWTASSSSTTTPSRQTFPRRLSLLQNDSSSFSSPARDDGRRTSFTGPPKPLSLGSQSVTTPTTTGASGFDTPRRGKRTSLSYISSPSTSFKANDDAAVAPPLSRAPSTSSASGRTRTGSISRTTGSSRRRPSQASDADDWLMSEDDTSFSLPSAARAMAERDSAKVEAQFHDTGYREGITAGKLSTLQNGFDTGFNEVGALLGRQVGQLRGQVAALLHLLSPSTSSSTHSATSAPAAGRTSVRFTAPASTALPLLRHPNVDKAREELARLAKELDQVSLEKLAEPDYEALEHQVEHAAEDGAEAGKRVKRETEQEKQGREAVLEGLKERVRGNGSTRHARTSNSGSLDSLFAAESTSSTSSATLLRLIAEKERRVFELREELSTTENQLSHLRSTWQRLATRELGLPTPTNSLLNTSIATNGGNKREGSDGVADAWGSLKLGLNNLLESIATPAAPALPEKDTTAGGGGGSDFLRPTGGLGVLEEEGSDLGSGAVSPRSPRSPSASASQDTKKLLGFSVDSNGLAHLQEEEQVPPTPPKTEPSKWTSRPTSMLGSLSNLQSKLTDGGSSNDTNAAASGGGGGGWLAKRFKEAQQNASELLKEAERKLGDAMNLDDLLGLPSQTPHSHSHSERREGTSPRIEFEEPSFDTNPTPSPWYAAAGGQRKSSESKLAPEGMGRLSISSSSSRGSTRSLEVPKSPNLSHSPPVGGAPGSAGVFGLFMGRDGSQTDLKKRGSGDWGWGDGNDAWEEEEEGKKRESMVSIGLEDTPKPDQDLI